jgi:uncharacterized protein (TIGR01777 family)
MKVAVTGATGFVGSHLVQKLQAQGHDVLALVRSLEVAQRKLPKSENPQLTLVTYTPKQAGEWQSALSGCDGVVNLAGEPLAAERWTPERKQEIVESRQLGTRRLVEAIAAAEPRPTVLVSASAIGYYGFSETASFDETSPAGTDFLAQVCQAWETEAMAAKELGVRLVILRLGIVLGMGGAIAKMLPPFMVFAGGPIGSGRQWFSWVHIDDVVNLIIQALTHSQFEGVLNATAPQPLHMGEFCQTLGKVLNRPSWMPVPGLVLEMLLGEAAQVVLEGQQVLPKRTQEIGFEFTYPSAEPALRQFLTSAT